MLCSVQVKNDAADRCFREFPTDWVPHRLPFDFWRANSEPCKAPIPQLWTNSSAIIDFHTVTTTFKKKSKDRVVDTHRQNKICANESAIGPRLYFLVARAMVRLLCRNSL